MVSVSLGEGCLLFLFKQKTAYEMRISDWSSDVCSSDLVAKGTGIRSIARKLGRSPSTISRELKRNAATRSGSFDYRASTAQWHADQIGRASCRERVCQYV